MAGVEALRLRGVRRRGRPCCTSANARPSRGTPLRPLIGRRWEGRANRLAGPQLHGGRGITMANACSIRVRGVVQGVGFRPFVYRLARSNTLAGWVLNGEEGVEIYLEGAESGLRAFVQDLKTQPPPAASIADIEVHPAAPVGLNDFTIRESKRRERPTARISPDLPVCDACLSELFDPIDRRYWYPYINCTDCGPRFSVVRRLPYDRRNTTMEPWPLDQYCDTEYRDAGSRRFHAQPVACHACGPSYYLYPRDQTAHGSEASIRKAAQLLNGGRIL